MDVASRHLTLVALPLCFLISACGGSDSDSSNPVSSNVAPKVSITPINATVRQTQSFNLVAQASDSDGSISKVEWLQITGPRLTLEDVNSLSLSLTPAASDQLSPIEYGFRLTVTDDDNASSSADITFSALRSMNATQAARLLHQGTMGPTGQEIMATQGISEIEWLETQMQLDQTLHAQLLLNHGDNDEPSYISRINAWWNASLNGDDQLRQRVSFALSEIFVVSDSNSKLSGEPEGMTTYYDMLGQHAFGNYRDLLEAVTLSPVMGTYLSHLGNEKPDESLNFRPDENYAREVMQLFTIGLKQLNQDGSEKLDADGVTIPTYSQTEIEGYAHVFTGWTFAASARWNRPSKNYVLPMEPWEDHHATGAKILLNGTVLPAGQSARDDMTQALDNLFNHPNVAPFISKQLIQRLVTSNPTSQYVKRIADVFADNGQGIRGDLGSVISSILLDGEARQTSGVLQYFGKIREPLLRTTHFWRELDAASASGWFYTWSLDDSHGQIPLGSPSVFNFFRPDYQTSELQQDDLYAPELQIANDAALIGQFNDQYVNQLWRIKALANNPSDKKILMTLQNHVDMLTAQGLEALLDYYDLLFYSGSMSQGVRQTLRDVQEIWQSSSEHQQVAYLLFTISVSPDYIVQH